MAQKMHVLHHTPSRDFSHEKTTDPDTPALRRSRRHARMGLPLTGRHAAAGQGAGLGRDARRSGGLLPAQAHQGDAIRSLRRDRRPGTASRHRPGVPRDGRLRTGAGEQLRRGNRTAGRQLPSPPGTYRFSSGRRTAISNGASTTNAARSENGTARRSTVLSAGETAMRPGC